MGEVDYFTRERGGIIDWQRNGESLKENGYYTTLTGDEAVKLIDKQDGTKALLPLLRLACAACAYQAPEGYIDRYAAIADKQRRSYAAMITALDDQIGRVVAELDKKGLRNNTVILLASDNGGATSGLFASGSKSNLTVHWTPAPLPPVGCRPPRSPAPPFDGKDIWKTCGGLSRRHPQGRLEAFQARVLQGRTALNDLARANID